VKANHPMRCRKVIGDVKTGVLYRLQCKGRFKSESCGAQEVSHPRSKLSPFPGVFVKLLSPHGEIAGAQIFCLIPFLFFACFNL
jgi:hypothetical protein